jgi:hypothetical protein
MDAVTVMLPSQAKDAQCQLNAQKAVANVVSVSVVNVNVKWVSVVKLVKFTANERMSKKLFFAW